MKIFACGLLLAFALALPRCGCAQNPFQDNIGRDPMRNGLKNLTKEKNLWQGKFTYLNCNFNYTRDVTDMSSTPYLLRSSSYTIPLMFGRNLGENWAMEGGPFAGLTRQRYLQTSLLKTEDPLPGESEFSYGMLFGLTHRFTNALGFQLRYRYDLNETPNAWQPVQLGWNMRF